MNPEIKKHWEAALEAFNTAKTAFKNGESDSVVKKELHMAIYYGQLAVRGLVCRDIAIITAIFYDYFKSSRIERLGPKQTIDETLKALKRYCKLLPEEDYLPIPVDC